ncbi:polysaccharide biosynthesis/export family protein [Mesorhizobium sp. VK4C]|uniref:polysaccharide biosynthesis/export family protein n=1 Tax=Mesorhizobium captivum TaxID=3072319 RepID=UPI002A24A144|nr:polysaccharide biosynthesis/export family protein [Mesorhizobium sp. VK4C]MDX8500747.1 polysaccharide biosynthesis/export family protein [Mesorhizobium sp. VK4C]
METGEFMHRNVPLYISLTAAVALTVAAARAEDGLNYTTSPQDKLSVRVYDWQQADGTLREWPAFNGEFVVGSDGRVELPLIGLVDAASRSAPEIAVDVANRLQAQVGLIAKPSVIVGIAEYRPYYVMGDVDHPGEFAFKPGLTALKAFSIAGGFRLIQATAWQPAHDLLSAAGDMRTLSQKIDELKAKRARLGAELAGESAVSFPPELGANSKSLVERERQLFEVRRNTLRQGLNSLASQKALNEEEVKALQGRIAVKADQSQRIEAQIERTKGLVQNGLITTAQILTLQQAQSDLQSQQLDINGRIFIVREQISKTEKDMLDLQSSRQQEVLADMQATEASLQDAVNRIQTLSDIMGQAQATIGTLSLANPLHTATAIRFTIRRRHSILTFDDGRDPPIEPGDIVTVERTGSQAAGGPQSAAQNGIVRADGKSPAGVQ